MAQSMEIEAEAATPVAQAVAGATAEAPRYRPIAEYGVIGDCRTAALVGPDVSIDYLHVQAVQTGLAALGSLVDTFPLALPT